MMIKLRKEIVAILCIMLLISSNASATTINPTTRADIWSGELWVEGGRAFLISAQQKMEHPIAYNGVVYIPATSAGEWLGRQVYCDLSTKTVNFYGSVDASIMRLEDQIKLSSGEIDEYRDLKASGVEIVLSSDIKIVYDGKATTFENVNGDSIPLVIYKEDIYLPIRGIANLLGMETVWISDQGNQYIYMRSPLSNEQVEEIQVYIDSVSLLCRKLDSEILTLSELWQGRVTDKQSILNTLNRMIIILNDYKQITQPEMDFTEYSCKKIIGSITRMEVTLQSISDILKEKSLTPQELQDYYFSINSTSDIWSPIYSLKNALDQKGYATI